MTKGKAAPGTWKLFIGQNPAVHGSSLSARTRRCTAAPSMSIPWMSTRWARQEVRLGDTTDAPFACTLTLDAIPGVRGDVCTEACGSGRSKRQRQ
eukprot:917374-Prymnesium_polylepis.1